jgi:endonuclease G, mitochondrial
MISKKELKGLITTNAYKAAARWQERKTVRESSGTVKGIDEVEKKKSFERVENNFTRETKRPAPKESLVKPLVFPERIIKGNDLKEFPPNELARKSGIPVARIQTNPGAGFQPEAIATGFLVTPNLLLTNHHVFPTEVHAQNTAANFMYERTVSGINNGFVFALHPEKFFINDESLDFALVHIAPVSLDNRLSINTLGFLRLIETPGKIVTGQPVNIIQHPDGKIKHYAFQNNTVVDILENYGYVHYTTDTMKGSSGAPAYNNAWEVVALHHSGVPMIVNGKIIDVQGRVWDEENQSEDEIQWIANEGISVSSLIAHLKAITLADNEKQKYLNALLATTKDPLLISSSLSNETKLNPVSVTNSPFKTSSMSNHVTINITGTTNIYFNSNEGSASAPVIKEINNLPQTPGIITTEKKQNFDEDYEGRPGFGTEFLTGFNIGIPTVIASRNDELFMSYTDNKPYELKYHHYSLVMNKKRKLAMWTASNIDYNEDKKSSRDRKSFGGEDWKLDPRIPGKYQITDPQFYKPATKVDRGHLVRREDNCWGNDELEIEYANADTYHWTNCSPQHELFNRAVNSAKGLWGMLENTIEEQLQFAENKAIVFAGPVLNNEKDPSANFDGTEIQYPLLFWKIVVVCDETGALASYGFLLDQTNVIKRFGLEALDFSQFKRQQATIQKITELSGVVFDQQVYDADVMAGGDFFESGIKELKKAGDIILKRKA